MRATSTLLKYTPLIKFVGGAHSLAGGAAKAHPLSPTGKMPQIAGGKSSLAGKIELKDGEVLLRLDLSKRYQYKVPSAAEMDQIDSGGATLIY